MSIERVPHEENAPAPKKERTGFSDFARKLKTTVGLGAAIAGIGFTEGNFNDARAAETSGQLEMAEKGRRTLNDHEREEHFHVFTRHYTEAIRGFKSVKSPKDAKQVTLVLDSLVKFLKASEWATAGNSATLNKRFLISLGKVERMYRELDRQFGAGFSGERETAFRGVETTFRGNLAKAEALKELEKAEKKLSKGTTGHPTYGPRPAGNSGFISIGAPLHSPGNPPRLTPSRSQQKGQK